MSNSPEQDFVTFKAKIKTLSLSTLTATGRPNISYAPFIEDENGCFYLFLSQLASHTQDLLNQPMASILLIEDEQDARQLFARRRISYDCDVSIVQSGEACYSDRLDKFEQSFGSIIPLLRSLPDFILFKLTPTEGRYVQGFGKAYQLTGEHLTELEHVSA
jgi:putative heme iron utilization protein